MNRRRWFALAAIVLAATALGAYFGNARRASTVRLGTAVSQAAIAKLFAASLNDSSGKPQRLSMWRGQPLVVNFWATWCPPCREEMPAFSRLQSKYAASGVRFVGIALDTPENVAAFIQKVPVSYPLLMGDAEGLELTQQLGNTRLALPYTVVLDAHAEARLIRLGIVPESELDELLGRITRGQ